MRRITTRLLFLVLALAAGPAVVSACLRTPPPPADLILTNAIVRPNEGSDRFAAAIAIREGRLQEVGDGDAVLQLRGAETRVLDLGGAIVIPGMTDAHVHLPGLGETLLNQATGESLYVDLSATQSEEDAVQRLRARARALPSGQWILGKGWNEALWVEQELPTKRLLTEIIRYHPVFLLHADGQTVWVNQKALNAGGIDSGTPDPSGGKILRKPRSREPGGILIGSAWEPVLRQIPPLDPEDGARAVIMALERLAAMGYTRVQSKAFVGRLGLDDPGAPAGEMVELFRRLAIGGRLPIRVDLLIPAPSAAAEALAEREPQNDLGEGRLEIRAVDLLADGTPDLRSAAPGEQDAGTFEVGRWADLTVLSSEISSIPEGGIPGAAVLATFVAGREVYLREPFSEP